MAAFDPLWSPDKLAGIGGIERGHAEAAEASALLADNGAINYGWPSVPEIQVDATNHST